MGLYNSELSAADIAAVTGSNRNNSGFGYNDGFQWIIILFLFAMMNGGWNFGGGNNGGMFPYMLNQGTDSAVQRGFDQNAIMNGIAGLGSAINDGQMAQIQGFNNLQQSLLSNQMNMQNCCCDLRQQVSDLKYTIATENCADRQAISDGIRDVIASNTAATQSILDKLCMMELDTVKQENANLRTQLNMANLAASQNAQTSQILADNAAQTAFLRQSLNPTPIPAYVVQNPSCCNQNFGCGCAA